MDQEGGGGCWYVSFHPNLRFPGSLLGEMNANDRCADLNPAAWSALTNSQDGQVAVEWCVEKRNKRAYYPNDTDTATGVTVVVRALAIPPSNRYQHKTPRVSNREGPAPLE